MTLDLDQFKQETEKLVQESQFLHDTQTQYRNELAVINEEYHLWIEHVSVIEAALQETDEAFRQALTEAPDVNCPMCGQHYENHVADQFELVSEKDELLHALQIGRQKVKELTAKRSAHIAKIENVAASIGRINNILTAHRQEVRLRDVVMAQGRSEAHRVLAERLAELDTEIGGKQRQITGAEQRMQEAESKRRREEILNFFRETLTRFTAELDVSMPKNNRYLDSGGKIRERQRRSPWTCFLLLRISSNGTAVRLGRLLSDCH